MKSVLVASLLFLCCTAAAQKPTKTLVEFQCTCEDSVGQLYATAFRDLLATSPRYEEVSSNGIIHWQIQVVSLADDGDANEERSAAFGVVVTIGDTYITQTAQICGRAKVQACAAETLATFDELVTDATRRKPAK